MSKELKSIKPCFILDKLREWFELYGNQNYEEAEKDLGLALDELYKYQQNDNKIKDLEAKLAEKDEEIKQLNNRILFSQLQAPKEQILNIIGSSCCQYNPEKEKISFAVEQLEKVKEFTDKAWWVDGVSECVIDYIDDQIKQLKEK